MAAGKLMVQIIEARDLDAADSNGLSDPYAVVRSPPGAKHKSHKTRVVKKTLNPRWDDRCELPLSASDVAIEIFDWDTFRDDPLGSVTFSPSSLPRNAPCDLWLKLVGSKSGHLHLIVTVVDTTCKPALQQAPGSEEMDPVLREELAAFAKTQFAQSLGSAVAGVREGRPAPPRDYVILVDNSGSMAGGNWREAGRALGVLAPWACAADPDGITVYFFSDSFSRHDNVRTAADAEALFALVQPYAGTNLKDCLLAAFSEHFSHSPSRPSTLLVITDGEPADKSGIKTCIKEAAARLSADEELSITFVQVGNDPSATQFLQELDDGLGAKFDIVDTLTVVQMNGLSFGELVARSIRD